MKIAIYIRVSTKDQNLDTQKLPLLEYCKRNDYDIFKLYEDFGESGSKDSRPSFDVMLSDMRKGKFKAVLVYKLDRIGRSLQHLISLFQEFSKRDIEFISLTQNIDTTTPEGRMFLKILMLMAEYERDLMITRINAGIDRAKKQGKHLGRPIKQNDGDMFKIVRLVNEYGYSISKLSVVTGINRSMVYSLMQRAKQRGLIK